MAVVSQHVRICSDVSYYVMVILNPSWFRGYYLLTYQICVIPVTQLSFPFGGKVVLPQLNVTVSFPRTFSQGSGHTVHFCIVTKKYSNKLGRNDFVMLLDDSKIGLFFC